MLHLHLEYVNIIKDSVMAMRMDVKDYDIRQACVAASITKSNNIGNEKWKCNIILEMLDCLYGLSDCRLSIDEVRQCLTYAATIWIFM